MGPDSSIHHRVKSRIPHGAVRPQDAAATLPAVSATRRDSIIRGCTAMFRECPTGASYSPFGPVRVDFGEQTLNEARGAGPGKYRGGAAAAVPDPNRMQSTAPVSTVTAPDWSV
jgi:hypothetical protein